MAALGLMKSIGYSWFLVSLLAIPWGIPADANPIPLAQTPETGMPETENQETPEAEPMPSPTPDATEVAVKTIEVLGSTVFKPAKFDSITKPLQGKTVTVGQLQEAAEQITSLYLDKGYITSRAVLDRASLATGEVKIQVIEGSVEKIEIEGAQRLGEYVRSRLELGTGTPLNVGKLEDQLRLLRIDPLIKNIEASLKAGTGIGQSILVVKMAEANPFSGNVSIDNYSPPSVGPTRFNLNLLYRNLSGIGDSIGVSYRPRLEAFTDTYRVEIGYQAPLNPMNGTLDARVLIDDNKIVDGPFVPLNISGDSQRYTLLYRQPLKRTPREELALSVGFDYYNGQTFAFDAAIPFGFGPASNGVSRTSVFIFAQDYTLRDPSGAWAFRSQMRFGVCIFDATCNSKPIPGSDFFSWLGQAQRVQVIDDNNFLIIQLDLQLTPDPLLPSEQFAIGGAQSVAGYRQNVLAGDNGFRFSIEDRIVIVRNEAEEPLFSLAPFFAMGSVWNSPDNPNINLAFVNNTFIAGLGMGFIWQPIKGMNVRLDYAPPLVNLNIKGNNVQDYGFYFSIGYDF
jgi:hemolysin activation/secretion protein